MNDEGSSVGSSSLSFRRRWRLQNSNPSLGEQIKNGQINLCVSCEVLIWQQAMTYDGGLGNKFGRLAALGIY